MGDIKYGVSDSINEMWYGNRQVRSVYYGSTRVWGSTAPVENLQVSPNSAFSCQGNGGSRTVTVTCTGTWTASSNRAWITLSRNSGTDGNTCVITCAENDSFDTRNGTVTFTYGNLSVTIAVSQDGLPVTITVNPDTISAPAAGLTTQFSFTIDSRLEWTISSEPWITVDSNNLNGSGSRTNVSVVIAANTGASRTGHIYISESEGREGGSVTITVTQSGSGGGGSQSSATITPRAINWYNDSNNSWLNKQSWQIEFVGGDSTTYYNGIEVFIQNTDTGQVEQVLMTNQSLSLGAHQTVYWGLNAANFADHTKAQLTYNGATADDFSLVVSCSGTNSFTEEAYFEQQSI